MRAQLVVAVRAADWATIGRLGWTNVFKCLEHGWRKAFDAADAEVYADFLGDFPPQLVYDTVRTWPGAWRPSAGELLERVADAGVDEVSTGDRARLERERAAIVSAAVRAALAAGETECDCWPRPTDWTRDARGVLRHDHHLAPGCRGLEIGQVEDATASGAQTLDAHSNADR